MPKAPRRRDAAATRAALLCAARKRFAEQGYDNCGMREIASEAGVDAALVSRYFGCKEELFGEVLACSGDPQALMRGDRAEFAERVAQELVYDGDSSEKLEGLLIILRSFASPVACEVVQRSGRDRFLDPFATWLGGPDAEIRARLALGVIMGMKINRAIHGDGDLEPHEMEDLCRRTAAVIRTAIAEEI